MKKIVVNGEPFETWPLEDEDIQAGTLLGGKMTRKAMRIVCLDGDDAVLRNLRHKSLLEAEPICNLSRHYDRLVPRKQNGLLNA